MFDIKRYLSFLMTLILLLASCVGGENTDEAGQDEASLIINETTSEVRFVAEDSATLLPAGDISESLAEIIKIVYEPLFDFDESLNPIASLADDCTAVSPTLYRVGLRDGVTWHDGDEFNANDVVYTVNALKNSNSVFASDVEKILKAEVESKNSVLFTLSEPTPNFIGLLSFPIIKRNTDTEPSADFVPVGTGPYKFSEKRNNTYYFVKNEAWYNGEASDKKISITLLKDKESAVYAFEANEADVISSSLMDLTENTPRGQTTIQNYISNDLTFLGMNNSEGILSQPEIRCAISYLIDKNAIITNHLYGHGQAVDVPVYPKAWFYDYQSDMVEVEADANYLETLLNQNGWFKKEGIYVKDFGSYEAELTLSILTNRDNDEKMAIAKSIAETLRENGIIVKVTAVPYDQYLGRVKSMDFSMFIGEISMDKNMDPSELVAGGENYFAYQSEEMDAILERMGSCEDNEQLIQCYSEFISRFLQDMPFVPLFFREEALIASPELSGYGMPNYYCPFRNVENWYFSRRVELSQNEESEQ